MKNTICQLDSVTGGQMNSYVITTADGKIIVVDGGYTEDALKADAQDVIRFAETESLTAHANSIKVRFDLD